MDCVYIILHETSMEGAWTDPVEALKSIYEDEIEDGKVTVNLSVLLPEPQYVDDGRGKKRKIWYESRDVEFTLEELAKAMLADEEGDREYIFDYPSLVKVTLDGSWSQDR